MSVETLPFRTADDDGCEGVVTLTLDQPERKVTVLDRNLLERLDVTLDAIGDNPAGLVVASSSTRVFVAGADLTEIQSLSDAELDAYLAFGQRVLGRIASLRCMTVAAVDGAALGGGLELAMHCDAILGLKPATGHKPYQVGLPEATLGLCPAWGGTNLLPARIEPGAAIGMTAAGATIRPDEAHSLGLFEALAGTREELLLEAQRLAATRKPKRSRSGEPLNISMPEVVDKARVALSRIEGDLPDGDPSQGVVAAVRAGITAGWSEALRVERRELIRLRSNDATQTKLRAFFGRTSGVKT